MDGSHAVAGLAAIYGLTMLWIGYRMHEARIDGPKYAPILWALVGLAGLWVAWEMIIYLVGIRIK